MTQKRLHSDGDGAGKIQRLDKWLWYARVVKTRSLAAVLVGRGKVRVNRAKTTKPSHIVKPGDAVTVTVAKRVRILKVVAAGVRRGPAVEAQGLYEELTAAPIARTSLARDEAGLAREGAGGGAAGGFAGGRSGGGGRVPGAGRPTKRDRRLIERLKSRHDDR